MSAPTPTIASLKATDDKWIRDRTYWSSWLSLAATRTVEEAEAYCLREHALLLAEKKAQDSEWLGLIKTPVAGLDICRLRHAWQLRQIELTTAKAQQHINKLILWILAHDGKQRIMENLTNAIKNATHKREMKVNIVSFEHEDTVALNDEDPSSSLKIEWIVKKTNFLQQLAECFGPTFKVRRTLTFMDESMEHVAITLSLEFWP